MYWRCIFEGAQECRFANQRRSLGTLGGSTVEPWEMAEGVGFEPTVRLPVRLISSQVPLTTQPPFPARQRNILRRFPSRASSFGVGINRRMVYHPEKQEGAGGQNSPAPMLGVGRT